MSDSLTFIWWYSHKSIKSYINLWTIYRNCNIHFYGFVFHQTYTMCQRLMTHQWCDSESQIRTTTAKDQNTFTCVDYKDANDGTYRKTSYICRTLVGNGIVDHSVVDGAAPGGDVQTTSSFSTYHLASMDWAKTIASRDEKHLSFGIWCDLY